MHKPTLGYASFIGLFTLVVAQPVFNLVGKNVEFFSFRQSGAFEAAIFAITLAFVVPALLYFLFRSISLFIKGARLYVDLAWLLLLATLFSMTLLRDIESQSGIAILIIAVTVSVFFTLAFYQYAQVRSFIKYLALIAFLVPILFLWNVSSNLSSAGLASSDQIKVGEQNTPVFMLVFDELPLSGLLNNEGAIDSLRYPNFSKLAATSTWYQNASTVTDSTSLAIPAILTGNRPTPSHEGSLVPSTAANHPRNLFSLLQDSHNIFATETISRLCPDVICAEQKTNNSLSLYKKTNTAIIDSAILYAHIVMPRDFTDLLPPINSNWGGFHSDRFGVDITGLFFNAKDVNKRFWQLRTASAQDVHYIHLNMPHHPWIHYASGKRYRKGYFGDSLHPQVIDWAHRDGHLWGTDEDALAVARQRQQLQIAYSDKLLGDFVHSIRKSGLFHQALIIIVADHGSKIEPKELFRWATESNVEHLMSIPLMVKYPKQSTPNINKLNAEVTDIMPTIVDVLQVEHTWKFDGHSLLDLEEKPSKAKSIMRSIPPNSSEEHKKMPRVLTLNDFNIFDTISTDAAKHFRKHDSNLHGSVYLHDRSYATQLLGLDTSKASIYSKNRTAKMIASADFSNVKLHRLVFPGFLQLEIPKQSTNEEMLVAFALNGAVQATRLISASNPGKLEVVLPESAFLNGTNQLEIFLVEGKWRKGDSPKSVSLNESDIRLQKLVVTEIVET